MLLNARTAIEGVSGSPGNGDDARDADAAFRAESNR